MVSGIIPPDEVGKLRSLRKQRDQLAKVGNDAEAAKFDEAIAAADAQARTNGGGEQAAAEAAETPDSSPREDDALAGQADARPRIVATYPYVDEHGAPLYEVVRYEPKDFRQRRPNGNGGWTWNLDDTRRVLYHLPRLLAEIDAGSTVFIVEGEKDVEAIEAAGACATCNSGGAAAEWLPEFSALLLDRAVIVVADRDKPGLKHARAIAAALQDVAGSVCLVEAAEGKDAAEHLAAGHLLGDFVPVPLAEPPAEEPAGDDHDDQEAAHGVDLDRDLCVSFDDIEFEPVEWIWQRWIPAGMVTILFGLSGLGKSHLYVDITGHISNGTNFPDGSPAPLGNVVIISAEDSPKSVIKPRLTFAGANVKRVFSFPSVEKFDENKRRVFSIVDDCEILKRNIIRHHATLGIIDPVTAYLSGVESHVVTEVRGVLALLDEVAQSTGVGILCVMHPNKNGGGDMKAVQRLSGSGAFGDAPRCVGLVAEDPDHKDEKRCLLLSAKMNLGLKPDGIGFHIVAEGPLTCSSGIAWDHDPVTVTADQAMAPPRRSSPGKQAAIDFLTAALADGEWHSASDLIDEADQLGISEKTLQRARMQMGVAKRKTGFQGGWEWCSEADFQ
jgi:putative DNA primase/helicase